MNKLDKQAGYSSQIVRTILGFPFVGTYNVEELVELEKNLRYMIEQKRYGYKYIEDYLFSLGYNLDLIRHAFERLTGVSPLEYLDCSKYLNSPPSIPGISYGWGKAKGKEYDYYFIMSWVYGYTIFGQQGDLKRDEIDVFSSLEEARTECAKLVDELFYFDKVLDIKLKDGNSAITSDEPIYVRSDQEDEGEKSNFEELTKEVEELESKPYDDLSKDETPQEFFTENLEEKDSQTITQNIEKILDHLKNKTSGLQNFNLKVKTFKYQQKEIDEQIERMPQVGGDENIDKFFSSTAIMPVLLEIEDTTLPVEKNKKGGLVIFSIVDSNVSTSDKFKGEDNRMYALTQAGLDEYFRAERLEEGVQEQGLESLEEPQRTVERSPEIGDVTKQEVRENVKPSASLKKQSGVRFNTKTFATIFKGETPIEEVIENVDNYIIPIEGGDIDWDEVSEFVSTLRAWQDDEWERVDAPSDPQEVIPLATWNPDDPKWKDILKKKESSLESESEAAAKIVVSEIYSNFAPLEEATEEVNNLIREYCEDFKNNAEFIKGLAGEIEGVWEVNPGAEDIQAIFIADASGNVTFEYIGGTDYWSGVSPSDYPYKSFISIPGKPEESDEALDIGSV